MSKKVLVISTTLRNNGNSQVLAQEFAKGADAAGNQVEIISLKDKTINFCKGCMACEKNQVCAIKDDAVEIAAKMRQAEVIAFATPIYYYEMCGQMKTLLDRCNSLYFSEYSFRDIYLLATAAESPESAMDGAIKGLEGWIACFDKASFKGAVFAGGVNSIGEIAHSPALPKAYEAGKGV